MLRDDEGELWVRCMGFYSDSGVSDAAWIRCSQGKIASIQHSPPDLAPSAPVTNLDYLVPLLADTHVHFYMQPWPLAQNQRTAPGSASFEVEVKEAQNRVKRALAAGVGFLRDMGDPFGINLAVKRHFLGSDELAPELQVAGTGIHRPNKYGRFLGVMRDSIDEIKETIWRLIDEEDVDFVKLVTTGIVNFDRKTVKQKPQFTAAELSDLVDFVHRRGRKVAAHCSGKDGLSIAIDANVDFIEHAYFITEAQLRTLTTKQLVWTPTFVPVYTQAAEKECGWPEEICHNIHEILDEHNRMVSKGVEQDALVMAGTDAGCPGVEMGSGLRTELRCLAKSGIGPSDLLRMATTTNATLCDSTTYTGKIEAGSPASFGSYRKPPWADIGHLESLAAVFHHGERVVMPPVATKENALR